MLEVVAIKIDSLKIFFGRISRLRWELKLFAPIAIISVLLIELWLNKIPAFNDFIYDFGVIYLKLCYSFISAFIFYLLVVYFPKERKKLKSFLIVANKISIIHREVNILLLSLFKSFLKDGNVDGLTEEEINEYCKKINPKWNITVVDVRTNYTFNTYYDYFILWSNRIKNSVKDLLPLYDIINDDVFKAITELHDFLDNFFSFDYIMPGNVDLEFMSSSIHELKTKADELQKTFRKKNKNYTAEFHYLERQKNIAKRNKSVLKSS